MKRNLFSLIVLALGLISCKTDDVMQEPTTEEVPVVFDKFNSSVEVYIEGNFVVLKSNGIPDHKSPYSISAQSLTFKIPVNPQEASTHSSSPLGPIGIAINGVPIFNQYAGPNQPLTNEINSFDQYNGHPQQSGQYHYHVEPLYITVNKGKSALLGFLLDGFPVYGPEENSKTITNADLDDYHGHFGVTADYPNGIYHYHITSSDPYINGDGFFGTAGTVSN